MKKSLIALAVASAVSAPAFAATSNVDIYGVMNLSVDYIDPDHTGQDAQVNVNNNNSRIGFKGTEDLGGGLAAVWQIESGFNADGTNSSAFTSTRNTFVGLKGGFGTVLLGKMDTPMKALGRAVDNFGDGIADSRNILGSSTLDGKSMFDLRTNNTIAYVTPDFSGLSAVVAYVTDSGAGNLAPTCTTGLDCNKADAWSAAVNYNNGPLMLGAGYERHNLYSVAGTNTTFVPPLAFAAGTYNADMWRIVGAYTFGNFKLGAEYEAGSGDHTAPVPVSAADRNAWGVFGNYVMGAVTLKANYLQAEDAGNVSGTGAKQYTFGADYALSKRSVLYALYAKVDNDANARFGMGVAQGTSNFTEPTLGGTAPSVFGIGMKHSF